MGFQDFYSSDYGSGRSSTSGSPWGSWDKWDASAGVRGAPSFPPAGGAAPRAAVGLGRAASFGDVGSARQRGNIEEVMLEFQLNGSDSPYDPEEEQLRNSGSGQLSGMGPAAAYLRQKSWPAPDRSPAVPLPLERSPGVPMIHNRPDTCTDLSSASSSPLNSQLSIAASGSPPQSDVITAEQMRVLQQLPDEVLHALLRDLQAQRDAHSGYRTPWMRLPEDCRFCKNNGERELFYRSHVLKDAMGRVSCPVLRAFTCKRCGAKGDSAHTIKYCPLSTREERNHSVAMMRSVQLQSRRRRMRVSPTSVHSQVDELTYTFNGSAPPSAPRLNYTEEPLDPLWAALERQLLL